MTIRESFGADSIEVEYYLDEKENITLPTIYGDVAVRSSNVSLSELSEGVHNVTVYAKGISKMTNWNTKNSTTCLFRIGESESFPTSTPEGTLTSDPNFSLYTGLALLTIVIVVFAVFLFYFKKRKH